MKAAFKTNDIQIMVDMKLLNAVTNPSLIFYDKKILTNKNELGLHARASNKLSAEAAKV